MYTLVFDALSEETSILENPNNYFGIIYTGINIYIIIFMDKFRHILVLSYVPYPDSHKTCHFVSR